MMDDSRTGSPEAAADGAGDGRRLLQQSHQCDVRSTSFRGGSILKAHRRAHVAPEKRPRVKCDAFDELFASERQLTAHCRGARVVDGKPYECGACGKSFGQSGALTVHRRTHTGEKPYRCDLCGKSFGQSGALTTHRRTHTGEKPYRCDLCDGAFGQKGVLTSHRRTHTGEKPYRCDGCDKSFGQSGALVVHRRTHTGEKPYRCDGCDKSFGQSGTLTAHRRTHRVRTTRL